MATRTRVIALVLCALAHPVAAVEAPDAAIVDPFAVVSALDGFARMPLWPGFDPSAQPFAIFDGERTVLWRHPSPPEGFEPLEGREGGVVYPGRHPAMRWNSNVALGGIPTATLLLTIEPGREVDLEASFLLHEVFHVFSKPRHPAWRPNEMHRYSYPVDDVENYFLLLLEEEVLARAVEAEEDGAAAEWAAAALRRRRQRTRRLAEEHRTFETALEMQEGTAVYVARLALGSSRDTTRLRQGCTPEQIRWRFYDTGAALAATLDRLDPSWKKRLEEEPGVTLSELLEMALGRLGTEPAGLTASEIASIRAVAKEAVDALKARRAQLRNDFQSRGLRVVVTVAEGAEPLRVESFDPVALEILDGGEALHPHRLILEADEGKIEVENPRFTRGSTQGVVALTAPAGAHPLLEGVRRVTVSGFSGKPRVKRDGGAVTLETEGLRLSFQRARLRTTDEEILVLLQPPEPAHQ
jgi:hypothetical protein